MAGVLACLCFVAPGRAQSPAPPQAPMWLADAAFAQGRVWVLNDRAALVSMAEDDAAPRIEPLEWVESLCVRNGEPLVVLQAGKNEPWRLRRHTAQGWTDFAEVATKNDQILSLTCGLDEVTLLTTRRLVRIGPTGPKARVLSGKLLPGRATPLLSVDGGLYAGIDLGEFGGGLIRIDPATGAVTPVESRRGGGTCEGPLNSECDPVVAIAPTAGNCLVAAISQLHGPGSGRVVEVCGARVRRLYFKPAGPEAARITMPGSDEPYPSVPFTDLARSGQTLWVAGGDGLYRIDAERVQFVGGFEGKVVGDYRLSFAIPGIVAVGLNNESAIRAIPLLVER